MNNKYEEVVKNLNALTIEELEELNYKLRMEIITLLQDKSEMENAIEMAETHKQNMIKDWFERKLEENNKCIKKKEKEHELYTAGIKLRRRYLTDGLGKSTMNKF